VLERAVVAAVVVDHPVAVEDRAPQHPLEFGLGVDPVRAGGDQDRDVLVGDVGNLLENRAKRLAPRLGARDVAHRDRDRLPGAHERSQRRAVDRSPHRAQERAVRVGIGRAEGWFDHRDRGLGEFHVEAVAAVVEAHPHGR
jgi:hypothetical protein